MVWGKRMNAEQKAIKYLEETELLHPKVFSNGVLNPKIVIAINIGIREQAKQILEVIDKNNNHSANFVISKVLLYIDKIITGEKE